MIARIRENTNGSAAPLLPITHSTSHDRSEDTHAILNKYHKPLSAASIALHTKMFWICLTLIWTVIVFLIWMHQASHYAPASDSPSALTQHASSIRQALKDWSFIASHNQPLSPSQAVKLIDPVLLKVLSTLHISSKYYHLFVTHEIDSKVIFLLTYDELASVGLPVGNTKQLWNFIETHRDKHLTPAAAAAAARSSSASSSDSDSAMVVQSESVPVARVADEVAPATSSVIEEEVADADGLIIRDNTVLIKKPLTNEHELQRVVTRIQAENKQKQGELYNQQQMCALTTTSAYQGSSLGSPIFFDSITQCCDRCYQHAECVGFTYNTQTTLCVLFRTILSTSRSSSSKPNGDGLFVMQYQATQISGRKQPENCPTCINSIAQQVHERQYIEPEYMNLPSPHPQQENRNYPHCPPMDKKYVPEKGRSDLCTQKGVPHGAPCLIDCDPGWIVKGQIPLCFSNNLYLFGAWGPPRVLCVPKNEDPHTVALQYETEESYPTAGVSTPYLMFGPLLAHTSPPALVIHPDCKQAHCTLSDWSFKHSTPNNQQVLDGLNEYIAGLNNSFYPLDNKFAPESLGLPDYKSNAVLEQYMDPTETYSIWPPPIIILNLIFRQDRLSYALRTLAAIGYPLDRIYRFNAVYGNVGALACSASHMEVAKWASKQGFKFYMVVEDDLFVRIPWHTFIYRFNSIGWEAAEFLRNEAAGNVVPGSLNFKFDGITFGGTGKAHLPGRQAELGLQRVRASSLSTAYLMPGENAIKQYELFLEFHPKHLQRLSFDLNGGMRADDLISRLETTQIWYIPHPEDWIKQTDGVSDLDFGFITREMKVMTTTDGETQRQWEEWKERRKKAEAERPRGVPVLPTKIPANPLHPGHPRKDTAQEKTYTHAEQSTP